MFLEQLEERSLLAVMTWDGSANALWSNPANWVGDVAPLAGDDLVFPGGAGNLTNTNDFAAGTRFNTILIQAGGYNISGSAVDLYGGVTANNATGNNTLGLDLKLINAQSFVSANAGTTLTLSGAVDTVNIIGTTQIFGTSALTLDGSGTLNMTGSISGAGSVSKLGAGMAILAGSNTYEGITDVRQGFLRVTSNTGLGSATTGDTQVQAGAQLQVAGNLTIAEALAIREGGVGFGNGIDPSALGALRSVSGSSTLTGGVELAGGNNLIGADTGSTLILSGAVSSVTSGTNRLIKVGGGTLQLAGTQDNVFRGETRVFQGTLELNKTAGKNAIGGDLVIGDNINGNNSATVRLLANNQIPEVDYFGVAIPTITLFSAGVLDLNGRSDTLGNLVMTTGATYSADIVLGGGTLTMGGNLTVNNFQGSSGVTPAATISGGTLDLGAFFSGGAAGSGVGTSRTITVNDTQLTNLAADLTISANITGGSAVGITRRGGGTLRLSGNNTYAGPTILIDGGIMEIGTDTPFGTGLLSLQNNNTTFLSVGGAHTIPNTVSLDSNLFLAGTNNLTFSGPTTMTAGRTIAVSDPGTTLIWSGVIGEGIFGTQSLAKSGYGTLALTAANTYSGATTVNDDGGTLILRGAGSILNSTNNLTIGVNGTFMIDNNSGGNLADRVNDNTFVNLSGKFIFRGSATANSTELLGNMQFNGAVANIVQMENTSGGAFTSAVTVNQTSNYNSDRTNQFIGVGVDLSATGPNRFSVQNPPGLTNGILVGTTVRGSAGTELATLVSNAEGLAVVALPAAVYVTELDLAGPSSNLKLTTPGTYTLSSSRTINSLLLGPGVTLTSVNPNVTLTLNASTVVFIGSSGSSTISVGNFNPINGSVFVDAGVTGTIASNIVRSSGAASQVNKGGPGKLILTGDNQFDGNLTINEGILNIQRSTAVGGPQAGTFIRNGATLEIEQTTFGPVTVGPETLEVRGSGVGGGTVATNAGALRNITGNNSWAGTINRNGNNAPADISGLTGNQATLYTGANTYVIATGSQLTFTGSVADGGSNPELIKRGGGLLEFAGVLANNIGTSRVLDGTLLLNKEPGVLGINTVVVGSDQVGAPIGTLRLAGGDQIGDGQTVQVNGRGVLDLNGNADLIGALNLVVGPNGGGSVTLGGSGILTVNGTTQVFTQGTGNTTGATISGGTFALQQFGVTGGARTLNVNDGVTGDDLTITSTIVDGSGIGSLGITKTGFGTLVLGGTVANTFTGTTTVNEGEVALAKPAGVNALAGPITIGDNLGTTAASAFASSDIVRLRAANQIPDNLALITVTTTGLLDLAGFNETIGTAIGQAAISLQAGSTVNLNGGTLGLNGNITSSAGTGATLWTPIVAPRILGGTLDLGSLARTIDQGGDQSALPYELEITSAITGGVGAGIVISNSGTLLLSGNSTFGGDFIRSNGNVAVGSDTALGTSRVLFNGGAIFGYGGARTIANELSLAGTIGFGGGNGFAGVGAVGGGGNDVKFTGIVNLPAAVTFVVNQAANIEFSGGIGETFSGASLNKSGYGALILSGINTYSGGSTVNTSGGHFVLRGGGTALNNNFNVNFGGVLQIDNSTTVLTNRIGDTAQIQLTSGTLAFIGKTDTATTESIGQLLSTNNNSSAVQLLSNSPFGVNTLRSTNLSIGANQGNTLNLIGRGASLGTNTGNRIAFNVAPTLVNAIIPTAVITNSTGLEFTTIVNPSLTTTPFDNFVAPLTSGANFTTNLATATATQNVKLTASVALGAAAVGNALLLVGNNIAVTGAALTLAGTGLIASSGTGNSISGGTLTLGGAEGLVFVDRASDLTLAGPIAGATSDFGKGGAGRLTLTGANTYTGGTTWVTQGVVRAQNNDAFGAPATASNVQVMYSGTVELNSSITIPATKTAFLRGNGEFEFSNIPFRNVGGTNTWSGTVDLQNNRTGILVDPASSLILAGVVQNQSFNKLGAGTLQLAGATANTWSQASIIWQGLLELNKTAGVNAIPVATTFGDYVGTAGADVVRLLQANQIADTAVLTLNSTALWDLNNLSETLAPAAAVTILNLNMGPLSSSSITTGTGTLTLAGGGGNIVVNSLNNVGLPGGAPTPATIAGNLAFGAAATITVNDATGVQDLVISAAVTGGVAVTKAGTGRMVLSGNNIGYTSAFTVNGGEMVAATSTALGSGAATTTVNNTFSLLLDGSAGALALNHPLNINGVGFGGEGAVRNIAGANSTTGTVTLAGTSTIGVDLASSLNINSVISGGGNGVNKLLGGTLRYSGGTANTYTGTTTVFEGTLELNKTAGVAAVAGPLTVGNDAGPQDSDVVRLLAADQIADGGNNFVQVTPSGFLDLNGNNETLQTTAAGNAINFVVGITTFPKVSTGAGTLTLGGAATFSSLNVASAAGNVAATATSSPGATILGNLNLGNASRTINVVDSGLNIRELQIDAVINGGGATGAINSTGGGILVLAGNNSAAFPGGVTLNGSNVVAGNNNAFGTGTLNVLGASSLFSSTTGFAAPITLPVANPITLNNNLTIRGDQNLTINGVVSQVAAARTLTTNLNNSALLDFAGGIDFGNFAGNTLSLVNNTFNGTVDISGKLTDGVSVTGGYTKTGTGILRLLNNSNDYDGTTTISTGIVRALADNVFGTAIGATIVSNGRVDLAGGRDIAEPLTLNNNAQGFSILSGAIVNTAGNNTWSGPITLIVNQNHGFGVDAGTLFLTGAIGQTGNAGIIKQGNGTLEIGGIFPNTYTANTVVRQGTVNFNKIAGVNAFPGGTLVVGDEGGGANADKAVFLRANQIPAGPSIQVTSSGLYDQSTATQGFLGSTALNEVQLITYSAVAAAANTFTITVATGQTTGALPVEATVAQVQTALDTVLNTAYGFTAGTAVTVSGLPGAYFITFIGPLGSANVPALTVAGTGMTPVIATLRDGIGNEVQTFTPGGAAFNPTYNGAVSGTASPAAATAAQVQTAIASIPGFSGNVTVIGPTNGPYTAIFNNGLAGVNLNQFTGTTVATVANAVGNETQQLTFTTLPTAGQPYFLGLGGLSTNVTFNAATARTDLQAALDSLLGVGIATAMGPATAVAGSLYTIGFGGAIGSTNLPQLLVRPSSGTITNAVLGDGTAYSNVQSLSLGGAGNEVQSVTVTATGGTFTVTFGANTSAAIAFNANASTVQTELERIPSIGVGNVAVTGVGSVANPYVITFQGALGNTDVAALTLNTGALTGGTATQATVTNGASLGGTYTLSFNAGTTAAINVGDSAASIQTKLEVLAGVGNVKVLGSSTTAGGTYLVVFTGTRANLAQAPITATSSLTGTSPFVTPVTLLGGGFTGNETQSVTIVGNGLGGYFQLVFNGQVTTPILAGANAATVQAALQALGTVGAGNAIVTQASTDSSTTYYVTFAGTLNNQDVTALTLTSNLTSTVTGFTLQTTIVTEANGFATMQNFNGNLILETGPNVSGNVTTGNNVIVSNANNLFVNTFGATTSTAPAATFSGNLNLPAGRNFQVNDTFIPNAAEDFVFSGFITGAGNPSTSAGVFPGTMALTAASPFSGNLSMVPARR